MQARSIVALLAALAGAAQAGSPPVNWPGTAPCNTTLQACIDAVPNGSIVHIVTNTAIDENLNLYNRSLTVAAGPGFKPRLASTRWISVTTASIAGDQTVNLAGLTLTNGYVAIGYSGLGTGRYDVRGMTLQSSGSTAYIRVAASNASTVEATVYDNRVTGTPPSLNNGLIEFVANGSTLNASALYNHVTSAAPDAVDGSGIFVNATAGASGTTKIHANEVRGSFYRGGIVASEGLLSGTASNYAVRVYSNVSVCAATPTASGTGIGLFAGVGTLNAQAVNNTVSRCDIGLFAVPWNTPSGAGVQIAGIVKNNLLVATASLVFDPAHTTSLANDYNLLNGGTSGVTAGSNTVTAPARLVDPAAPRLMATSPAINAADTATLGLGLIFNGLPAVDADGLRRIKGDDGDIGAYEYGDRTFRHTSTAQNTSSYITTFNNDAANGQSAANLIVTPNFGGNAAGVGVPNNEPFGIYYASSRWLAFNQDTITAMPSGAKFNVFAPAASSGAFRHVSTGANTVTRFTTIDNGATNGVAGFIVLATQNWSAGASIYNDHPIGVNYSGIGSEGRWQIVNLDASGAAMPLSAGFNVYAQPPSPNAFRVTATTSASSSITLDHPLLNGVPCAQVQTTRLWSGTTVDANHDVYYDSDGRWRIFSYAGMPAGTTFHVVVDPRQVYECTDRIFANGFQ